MTIKHERCILNARDAFPDLTLLTAATVFNESEQYDVKVIDAIIVMFVV